MDSGYGSYHREKNILESHGYTLKVYSGTGSRDEKIKYCAGSSGLFVRGTKIDRSMLMRLPDLRAIVRYGVGFDNIDLAAASERGVRVANVQGYANHSVSDHALALMYACARALFPGVSGLLRHFAKPPRRRVFEFRDKTLGIVGLGNIGGTLCHKARGLFDQICAVDPYVSRQRFERLGARRVTLDTLLKNSHVISLHCNLTPETQDLFDETAFAKMRQVPVLINTARGPVVNETALLQALESEQIHSAGVDVYSAEPPGETQTPLLEHPRLIGTGHYAWYSDRAAAELQRRAADNMLALLSGEIPEDCLNPER